MGFATLRLTSGDQELWACARSLKSDYGEGAFLHAALKVDRYYAKGMGEAAQVWHQVLKRIEVWDGYRRPCKVASVP